MEDLASLGFRVDSSGLRRGAGDLDRFGNSGDRVDRTATRLSSRTFPALISVVGVASAALGGLTFGRIISEFASFEQGMQNVGAVSSATTMQLEALSDEALRAAASTRFNPAQTTKALYALASSGQAVEEQMASLPNVLNLAEAGQSDLGRATELTTATINQFNLEAEDSGRVADVFVAAIADSSLNVNRLQVAMRNAGPTAAAMGQSLEATTATLGILTTSFGNGERAGTGFRAILNELPDKAAELGISIKNANGQFKPMVDILEELENKGITANKAVSDFGAEAGPALAALITQGSAALREMEVQLQSTGQAADTAAKQMDTLRGDMDAFGSAVDVAFIKIGDAQSTVLRGAIQQATDLVRLWSGYGDTLGDAAEQTEALADAVAVVAIVVGGKFAGALAVSGGKLAFNAVQAVRVQLALGRMAGASTAASASMLALGGAARAASASMAFLGGPVGIALIAAGSLYYFRDALFGAREEVSKLQPELDELTESMNDWTEAQLNSNRVSLVSDLTEARLAADKLSVSLEIAEQKEKMSNITSQGRSQAMGANTVAAEALRKEYQAQAADVEALESVLADLDEQLKIVTDRKDKSTKTTTELAGATNDAAIALQLELTFLRAQNALVEAGISASEAEIAVMETKKELMLENKGLTAAEAVEYVALEKAIRGALDAEQEQASINKEASGIAASLLSEEDAVLASYERRRDIILNSTNKTGQAQKNLLVQLEDEKNKELSDLNAGYWEKYLESAQENLQNFDELSKTVIDNFAANFGSAFESIIFDSESLGDAMYGLSDAILRGVVNSLAQIAVQWAINQALILAGIGTETAAVVASEATKASAIAASTTATQASYAATATANALAQQQMAGLAAYASTAAIPVAGPALAPAAYLTAVAATTPMVTAVSALTAAGMAHDGIDSVPEDGTWNLQKGERVVTSETSAKLDTTLDRVGSGGGGISVTINDQTTTSTGHDVQTQETTGPEGQRQMQITIRDTVRRQVMQGEFDKQLGSKFDLKSKGRRV